jgi:hypothetical protein
MSSRILDQASRLRRRVISSVFVLLIGLAGAGCIGIQGNGVVRSEERGVVAFHEIDASGAVKLEIVQGSPQRVEVSTDDNLLPLLRTEVRGGKLTIDTDTEVDPTGPIRIRIVAPFIDAVSLSGSSEATIQRVEGQNFRLATSGSSSITLHAMSLTGTFAIDTSGSSEIRAQGASRSLAIDTSGSCTIDTRGLAAESVTIDSSGSSDITVHARDSLTVDLSGSSSVGYLGDPKVAASMSGSGELERL